MINFEIDVGRNISLIRQWTFLGELDRSGRFRAGSRIYTML